MKTNQHKTLEQYLPVPMPLGTAPSLIPDTLTLLVRALWGARLGRNRHLVGTTPGRLMSVIRGNIWQRNKTCWKKKCSSY